MSVVPSDIVIYGSASMPEADGQTVGGAIDFTKRVVFYDLAANDTVDAVSSASTDTLTRVQIMVRDTTGAVQSPPFATLNGTNSTTPVLSIGGSPVSHFLATVLSGGSIAGLANPGGSAATGDVAVYRHTPVVSGTSQAGAQNTSGTTPALFHLAAGQLGVGGTIGGLPAIGMIIRMTSGAAINQMRQIVAATGYATDTVAVSRDWGASIPATDAYVVLQGMLFESTPNAVRAITRMFATSAADVAGNPQRVYYEKVFAANNNAATALTGAAVQIASDTPTLPTGTLLDIGVTPTLTDTATIANRQAAAPAGITFVSQTPPTFVNILPAGNLPPVPATNGAQGIWVRLTLPGGSSSYTGAANFRIQGTTT